MFFIFMRYFRNADLPNTTLIITDKGWLLSSLVTYCVTNFSVIIYVIFILSR